ncbi:hypothetical protein J3R30DRAFT_3743734 [Lentinula aciculospora]|uniref:Uncharacterized protein n=1 Tax=Lentinula aciculospora TaxID=153920 RepID=A0A9W8ZTP1_9AGAR|nr:hypothetical protein J3R30DRAFT_3743734 [Lentinula aciculospora]
MPSKPLCMNGEKPGCTWTSTLHRLFSPYLSPTGTASYLRNSCDTLNKPTKAYLLPSGVLWRSFLAKCVYRDLLPLEAQEPIPNPQKFNLKNRRRRRFARMNEYGLGAVIFYEIPFNSFGEVKEDSSFTRIERWTLKGVFGDGEPTSGTGMGVEELLEGIDARIVYIPLYACTSFVTGQIMNSFFRRLNSNERSMNPVCIPGGFGFGVDSEGFNLFDNGLGLSGSTASNPWFCLDVNAEQSVPIFRPTPTEELAKRSRSGIKSGIETVNANDHYLSSVKTQYELQDPQMTPQTKLVPDNEEYESIGHPSDEQWELDWLDAELCCGSYRLVPGAHNQPVSKDSKTNTHQQDEYEDQDDEESFVTAMESFISDDRLRTLVPEKDNQSQDSHMYSSNSVAVSPRLIDANPTPTIISPPNAGLPIHIPQTFALSSITNLTSADSIATVSTLPAENPRSEAKPCSSFNVGDNSIRPDARSTSESINVPSSSPLSSSDLGFPSCSVISQLAIPSLFPFLPNKFTSSGLSRHPSLVSSDSSNSSQSVRTPFSVSSYSLPSQDRRLKRSLSLSLPVANKADGKDRKISRRSEGI